MNFIWNNSQLDYLVSSLTIFSILFMALVSGLIRIDSIQIPIIGCNIVIIPLQLTTRKRIFGAILSTLIILLSFLYFIQYTIGGEILISKDRIFVTRNENSEPEKHPICVGECGYIDMPRIEMVNTKVNKVDISFLAGYYANNPGTATIKLVFTSTKNMVNELPFSVSRLVNDSNYENTASLEQFFINEYRLIGSLYRLKLYICPGQWGSIIMHMKVSIPAEKVRLISLLLIAALNYVGIDV